MRVELTDNDGKRLFIETDDISAVQEYVFHDGVNNIFTSCIYIGQVVTPFKLSYGNVIKQIGWEK